MPISKLERVPLRELWKHEERGFSTWLAKNLDVLSDAIGSQLSEPEREVAVGPFQVDLVAEDEAGTRVVIENQLEQTDHDHLGKLLTYLTNLEAKAAIWITSSPRPEHIKAMSWLNETTPEDVAFFLVQLDAYRISGSDPAPLFTVIVRPSSEAKAFGQHKKEYAERHVLRLRFWESLLAKAKAKNVLLHAGRSPGTQSWLSTGAGKTGLSFVYSVLMNDEADVELYINTDDAEENKRIFDNLRQKSTDIERAFGAPLTWERLDGKRASRVSFILNKGGLKQGEQAWPELQEAMIDAMARLAKALKPHL